jgi:hypothetical protein
MVVTLPFRFRLISETKKKKNFGKLSTKSYPVFGSQFTAVRA